jgi:hypothetical protein
MSAKAASPGSIMLVRQTPAGTIEFEQRPPDSNGREYRAYHFVTPDGRRERFVSVTTFLKVLDKPALQRWFEGVGMRNAIAAERAGLLKGVMLDDVVDTLRENKLGAEHARDTAAKRGVDIHTVLEDYLTKDVVPNPARFAPEHRGYIRALVGWLLDVEAKGFELEASEQLVAHPKLKYAGRMDLRARIGGLPFVIDLKTNERGRIYREAHYQVVAYAMADVECGAEMPHSCLIVALGADGQREVMQSCASPLDVKTVLDMYRRDQKIDAGIRAARERTAA